MSEGKRKRIGKGDKYPEGQHHTGPLPTYPLEQGRERSRRWSQAKRYSALICFALQRHLFLRSLNEGQVRWARVCMRDFVVWF